MNQRIEKHVTEMKVGHHFIKSGVWKDIQTITGRKYIKVVSVLCNGQHSVIEFIDPITGNIYKAKSWNQVGRLIGKIQQKGETKMNKTTKGTWKVESDGTSVAMGGQVVIVAPAPDNASLDEQKANARLIAAAPELLKALRSMCVIATMYPEVHNQHRKEINLYNSMISDLTR